MMNDQEVTNVPAGEVTAVAAVQPAARRGRPEKFSDAESQRKIGSLLVIYGLTGTQAVMASFGLGNGPESVSLPTLSKVAEAQGITFARGRKAA